MEIQANGFVHKIVEIFDNTPVINYEVHIFDQAGVMTEKKYFWFTKTGDKSLEDQALAALQARFTN